MTKSEKRYQVIASVFTVMLTYMILYPLFIWNGRFGSMIARAYSPVDLIVQLAINTVCVVIIYTAKWSWIKYLLIYDLITLTFFQGTSILVGVIFLAVGLITMLFKKPAVKLLPLLLCGTILLSGVGFVHHALETGISGEKTVKVYSQHFSPDKKHVIELIESYDYSGNKTGSHFTCKTYNKINLLIYHLEYDSHKNPHRQEIYKFTGEDDIPFSWLSEEEFMIDDKVYNVNTLPR